VNSVNETEARGLARDARRLLMAAALAMLALLTLGLATRAGTECGTRDPEAGSETAKTTGGRGEAGTTTQGVGGPRADAVPVPVPCLSGGIGTGQPPVITIRRMRVTAYCPCAKCCGRWADGVTASGSRADHPLVAAPKGIPFGTRVRVPGYPASPEKGFRLRQGYGGQVAGQAAAGAGGAWVAVEDRGGAIQEGRLDVLFMTHREAINWGVRTLGVEVETPARRKGDARP